MFSARRPMPPMNHPSMYSNPFAFQQQAMQQPRRGLGAIIKRLLPGAGRTNPTQGMQGMQGMQGFQGFQGFQGMQNMQGLNRLPNVTGLANSGMMQGLNSSTLKSLANPENLSSILGNVQKTLKMAESVVPMVQQYGPLVKNLPAMWKLYSELKNSGGSETEEKETETIDISTEATDSKSKDIADRPPVKSKPRTSVPKLYV